MINVYKNAVTMTLVDKSLLILRDDDKKGAEVVFKKKTDNNAPACSSFHENGELITNIRLSREDIKQLHEALTAYLIMDNN